MRGIRHQLSGWSRSTGAVAALVAVTALAGCGSSGSSPAAAGSGGGTPAGGTAATGSGGGGGNGKATCTQVTKADAQQLLLAKITGEKTTTMSDGLVSNGKAQQCVFATQESSQALTITVVGGKDANNYYADSSQGITPTAVPGVGAKAVRDKGEGSTLVTAEDNGVTCAVDTSGADQLPGVGTLEEAAGSTNDIGDIHWAQVASALGTMCNVVFGSGNTKPDFSKLLAAAAAAGTPSTGATLPTNITVPPAP
jgi:hypothetical protein